jgi:cytochrome c553
LLVGGALLGALAGRCQAADLAAGRARAAQCAVCHGPDGIAVAPDAPNLAAQNESYLAEQLTAFHDGTRQNDTMSMVAKPLSSSDIENLAAYYHSLPAK